MARDGAEQTLQVFKKQPQGCAGFGRSSLLSPRRAPSAKNGKIPPSKWKD